MYLNIHVVSKNKDDIINLYKTHLQKKDSNNTKYIDSGFDLFCVNDLTLQPKQTHFIDLGIQCSAYLPLISNNTYNNPINTQTTQFIPSAFYLYPRSSLSNTPLRLANSVGIIDSGYRGNIIAAVDHIGNDIYQLHKGQRLFQICSPQLSPIHVTFTDKLDTTLRGSGAFGSTGTGY